MSIDGTLSGVRVLELGSNIAAPMAAMVLGDLGADVVKVEGPGGDDTRSLAPVVDGESTVFRAYNRSKRSIVLDLDREGDRDSLMRLARSADVLIQNLRPGVADRLGFGYADVAAVNDRIVYCSISAFGDGAIGRRRPGYDALIQAFTGIMAATGRPGDDDPIRVPASLIDVSTGLWAALGVMAALMRRSSHPGPQYVDPTLLDSGLFLMSHQTSAYLATGEVPERTGSGAPSFVPYRTYRAGDGWVFLAAGTDRLFARLCDVVGRPDLAVDPRYQTPGSRVAYRDALDKELEIEIQGGTVASWLERLAAAGIPACPVNHLGEALAEPVTLERQIVVDGHVRLPIDRGRLSYSPPPQLGEHTADVLSDPAWSTDL